MSTDHLDMGSRVCVSADSLSGPATTNEFRIIDRYPVEGQEAMYRLASTRGHTERVVPEGELRRTRLHLLPPSP
jgi:hypothetical protein